MRLKDKRIGFAVTGSHCTLKEALAQVEMLVKEGAKVVPIVSNSVNNDDTRFGTAEEWKELLRKTCNYEPINTIVGSEPIGPQKLIDVLVVAPCTGNTLAKLANGITDSPVLMAIKAHLRNQRPVVLAIATNDGLGMNAKNIGVLLNTKNIYMVPFGQDNPKGKANSLVAHMSLLIDTTLEALQGKQYQPLLIDYLE